MHRLGIMARLKMQRCWGTIDYVSCHHRRLLTQYPHVYLPLFRCYQNLKGPMIRFHQHLESTTSKPFPRPLMSAQSLSPLPRPPSPKPAIFQNLTPLHNSSLNFPPRRPPFTTTSITRLTFLQSTNHHHPPVPPLDPSNPALPYMHPPPPSPPAPPAERPSRPDAPGYRGCWRWR